jgi:F-type H+-transporting ATPase subunit delta
MERVNAITADLDDEAKAQLAADLRAVAVVLAKESGLRRSLADNSRAGGDRTELADALFEGKISAPGLEAVRAAVSAHWSRPGDLVDAVELLAVDAELALAENDDALSDVEDELFRFGRIVEGTPELAAILGDPSVAVERRAELVRDLLSEHANPVTARLAEMAVHGFGGRGFDWSLRRLGELAAVRRDRKIAYVVVAAPISDEQEERLVDKLSEIYGRRVAVLVEVDPDLIGGATVRIGDDLYDGSVVRKLELARAALVR